MDVRSPVITVFLFEILLSVNFSGPVFSQPRVTRKDRQGLLALSHQPLPHHYVNLS